MKRHYALSFGAEPMEGGARFRLWAPAAESVDCVIEGSAPRRLPMVRQEGGWFTLTTDAARPGALYRYAIGDTVVPDPASRFQPDDVNGPSEVIDPAAHEWRDDSWAGRPWEEVVLYELHVGTFTAAGDYGGIERHLDHLAGLGVTAVELMPLADFPGRRNWGYDGVLPFAPDHRYGRPEALKHLVEACHERGLAILLDVVYNHFGPEGNYLHGYAPQFFTERHHTPWGAAINFDGPQSRAVRDFYIENALYWLIEYHFDGLRFDAVHAIADDSAPDILTELATTIRQRLAGGPPIHLILENDRNAAHYLARARGAVPLFTAQWNDDLHHALRVCAAGETGGYYADYADHPAERLGRALAEGFAYQGEASAYRDGEARGEPSAQLPPTAFAAFIQNHDQVGNNAFGTRLAARVNADALHAATAIVLLSPQIPMLFMGQEWGADQPFCYFCDFVGELAAAVRDGRRREFAKFPEFRDEAARSRIPDPVAEATFAGSVLDWSVAERPPYAQWLERHRRLLALRAREIVPRLSDIAGHAGRWRALGERAVLVSWRLGDGATLSLAANFSEGAVVVAGDRPVGRCLYATHAEARPDHLPPVSAAFFLADGGSR